MRKDEMKLIKEWQRDDELRIVKNFLGMMPKTYRKRSMNFVVVRDILMTGTSKMGRTSCCEKCTELGINPYGYEI